jgi:hypothetical protein
MLILHCQDGNEQLQTVVNSVMDVDGQTKMLESPYFIVLNKAPPVAISPLRYVQVPAMPCYQIIIAPTTSIIASFIMMNVIFDVYHYYFSD